ncbi:MAG: hypothetical protein HYX39_06600 [Bacteroidetes bacterium]|nr:hypothetical protein [Bacteroidota bacterium]
MKDLITLYIDPGTGSLLVQVIVGGIVAGSLFFKKTLGSFLNIFKRKSDKS